ncbi:hypothetical protein AVEN_146949-1 [Araneus ventricosus]|uniref:Uncharacterized protein n=1 Tax=Araneus ventricosus TaxID=182803 RepID=A0A4Y2QNK7_ARAVE|nr:hypothetical protein AVEN_146949-1 [Araneus ventricosus]
MPVPIDSNFSSFPNVYKFADRFKVPIAALLDDFTVSKCREQHFWTILPFQSARSSTSGRFYRFKVPRAALLDDFTLERGDRR